MLKLSMLGWGRRTPTMIFPCHVLAGRTMFRALAYRFVAEKAWAKDEYGMGVAYMTQAR